MLTILTAVFSQVPKNHWKDSENCRQFFDSFAKEQGFDPQNAAHWTSIDVGQMLIRPVREEKRNSFSRVL